MLSINVQVAEEDAEVLVRLDALLMHLVQSVAHFFLPSLKMSETGVDGVVAWRSMV